MTEATRRIVAAPGTEGAVRHGLGRRFYALWGGQSVSQLGDYVAYLTVPAFVAQTLTRQPTLFGYIFTAETLPTLLFGFIGGALLDRVSLRPVLIASDVLRAIAFFVLAFLAAGGHARVWMVVAIAFLVGSLAASFTSSLYAFLPSIVSQDLLASANSRLALSQQITFVLGPPIGGFVAATIGYTAAFTLNGLTFLVSAVAILLLGQVTDRELGEPEGLLTEARQGFTFLWRDLRLRLASLGGSIVNFVTGFLEAVLVLVGMELLGIRDPDGLGLLFAAMGLGGVLGALSAPLACRRLGVGRAFVLGMLIFGIGFSAVTFAPGPVSASLLFLFAFVGIPWLNVSLATMRQAYTPDQLLGRVTAASRAIAWGALPVGALLGTWAAEQYNLLAVVRLGPGLLITCALLLGATPLWKATLQPSTG